MLCPGRFTPRKDPVPIVHDAGWDSGPVWMGVKILPPLGFDPQTVQPIAVAVPTIISQSTAVRNSLH